MKFKVEITTRRVSEWMTPVNRLVEQQRTIRAWLLEAREHAMDAGSSDEKHAMFGKYKGRINNYLSAEGYDAKKAERELKDRKAKQ